MSKQKEVMEYVVIVMVALAALSVEAYLLRGWVCALGFAVFFGLLALVTEIEAVGHELMVALGHGDDEPSVTRRVVEKVEEGL